jgi:hypothetical protein
LELSLPPDYKRLVDAYGGGMFYGHIGLLVPPPTRIDGDLVGSNKSYMWNLNNLWSTFENRPPELAAVNNLQLVDWAETIDADTLNWIVQPGKPPESWPIAVLHCDLEDVEIYSMTATEFLAGLFARDFESDILTDHLNDDEPPFDPYPIAHPA